LLRDYAASLAGTINDFTQTNLIVASDLKTDYRTDKIGIVEGKLTFMDHSELFFTEYVDVRYRLQKLSYSYHYQHKGGRLIFRYDNARHKPALPFTDHKHLEGKEAVETSAPQLGDVLAEIMECLV
jgi:Family of unknown function (DUF6516)